MEEKLSEKEKKVIGLLTELGMPRPPAKIITFLSINKNNTVDSMAIEQNLQLRQPEVSTAMKSMRKNGWVKKRDEKNVKGKGRPRHFYSLKKPFRAIIKEFKDIKLGEMFEVNQRIEKLEKLVG